MVLNSLPELFHRIHRYDIANCFAITANDAIAPLNIDIWLDHKICLALLL